MFPGSLTRFSQAGKRFLSFGAAGWKRYNRLLVSHPIPTKVTTAGIIAVAADLVCQTSFPVKPLQEQQQAIDWKRTLQFTAISILFPPLCHHWYALLSVRIVGQTLTAACQRMALDQMLFAPPCLALFFTLSSLLQGHSVVHKLEEDFLPTMVSNYTLWVPAQVINFRFVPVPLRVLWANAVGFFWSIYLSHAANGTTATGAKADPAAKE